MLVQALEEIKAAETEQQLQQLRVLYLGKKGVITRQLKELGSLPPDQRRDVGRRINDQKAAIEEAIRERKAALERHRLAARLAEERLDVTLPGYAFKAGGLHLLTRVTNRLLDVFVRLGYEVAVGPELEDEWHNFDALNMPEWHPARDLMDTFWTTDGRVLRTHTSPMQVRYMKSHKPPFKVVVPGKVFRNEAVDATHEAQFHQLEALVVGERITMADLKGAIHQMAVALIGPGTRTRLQPSYFPFVEPVDPPPLRQARVARARRLRHGPPQCLPRRRLRRRHGLCLRLRHRAPGTDPLRHSRHSLPDAE